MTKWNAAADEARFREDSQIGDRWVRKLAERLRLWGLWTVEVPALRIRDDFEGRRAYRDDGDLFVNGHRVEVRSLGYRFTGPHDFPQQAVLVDLVSVIGAKRNTVAFVFISRQTGAAVGLYGSALRKLRPIRGVWNERRGVARDWMAAPKSALATWDQTVNYLAEKCQVPIER